MEGSGFWIAIVLAVFFFAGEPDLTDALINFLIVAAEHYE